MSDALAAVIALIVVRTLRHDLTFYWWTLIQLVIWLIGMSVLVDAGQAKPSTLVFAEVCVILLACGYELSSRLSRRSSGFKAIKIPARKPSQQLPNSAVWTIVVVADSLAFYHLGVSGIPLLSANIETSRFDVTSSGLFGIPGRMYLFGVTIAWILAASQATAMGRSWRSYVPWRVATLALVAVAVLGGLKSGVFAVVLLILSSFVLLTGRRFTILDFLFRYWWVAVVGIAYVFAVASLYKTYADSGAPLVAQLLERLTTVGSQPAAVAIEHQTSYDLPNAMLNDLSYFLTEYSGGDVSSRFSLEQLVSTSIEGFGPLATYYAPPVTVGAVGELDYSFGPVVAAGIVFFVGAGFAALETRVTQGTVTNCLRVLGALTLSTWIEKGGLAYQLLNNVAVVVFLALCACLVTMVVTLQRRGRPVDVAGSSVPARRLARRTSQSGADSVLRQ